MYLNIFTEVQGCW